MAEIERAAEPCFCGGPWIDEEPENMPETALGREHRQGDPGCIIGYPPDPRAHWPVDFEEGEA